MDCKIINGALLDALADIASGYKSDPKISDWNEIAIDLLIAISPSISEMLSEEGRIISTSIIAEYLTDRKWGELRSHKLVSIHRQEMLKKLWDEFPIAKSLDHTIEKSGKRILSARVEPAFNKVVAETAAAMAVGNSLPAAQAHRRI